VNVGIQISIRFQLLHNPIAVLHKFIGPEYLTSVISPEIGSQAREAISQYTAQEVYTSREAIQEKIRNNSQKSLGTHLNNLIQTDAMEQPDPKHYNDFLQNSIQILDTLVLGIELPTPIVAAINRQTEQYYQIQEFKFRVEREAEESKRKQIEANGIAAFQRTVSQGISESYLRWRGIEATLALAQSPNTKIVIIGSGKDGLPIILGNVDNPASAGPGSKPADATPKASATPPSADNPPGGSTTPIEKPAGSSSTDADRKTSSTAPAAATAQQGLSTGVDLSKIKAMLSRISEGLRTSTSAPTSGNEALPRH
jgi:regulator of protease activity HflC (stomatin/prohibitin superfamily)